jgi:hypothetical protein
MKKKTGAKKQKMGKKAEETEIKKMCENSKKKRKERKN